jgi:hypothetical protein
VEYLMSYWVALPELPSSPGAVQLRVIELDIADPPAWSETADGAVVSGLLLIVITTTGPRTEVAALAQLDIPDQLGTSSAVFRAK